MGAWWPWQQLAGFSSVAPGLWAGTFSAGGALQDVGQCPLPQVALRDLGESPSGEVVGCGSVSPLKPGLRSLGHQSPPLRITNIRWKFLEVKWFWGPQPTVGGV